MLVAERSELDLTRQDQTERYFSSIRPNVVIMAAGRVGGIFANDKYPANFLAENLAMALNCIQVSKLVGIVQKLLFLGSVVIYPKFAKQPMSEDLLLTGELEPTNEWYAVAKIAGIKLCEAYRRQYGCDFISVITPTDLWSRRQLSSPAQPRCCRADPAFSRGQDKQRIDYGGMGHGDTSA